MFVITVDKASPQELDAIHEVIKAGTLYWWHHFSNTWLVGGKTVIEWKDLIKPVLNGANSALLILALPEEHRGWWLIAPENDFEVKVDWLRNYVGYVAPAPKR